MSTTMKIAYLTPETFLLEIPEVEVALCASLDSTATNEDFNDVTDIEW